MRCRVKTRIARRQSAHSVENTRYQRCNSSFCRHGSPRSSDSTHPAPCLHDDGMLVLLRDQDACREGRFDRVDDQVVGQDVQLLHLVPGHIDAARDAIADRET